MPFEFDSDISNTTTLFLAEPPPLIPLQPSILKASQHTPIASLHTAQQVRHSQAPIPTSTPARVIRTSKALQNDGFSDGNEDTDDEDKEILAFFKQRKKLRKDLLAKEEEIVRLKNQIENQRHHTASADELKNEITFLESEKRSLETKIHDIQMNWAYDKDKISRLNTQIGSVRKELSESRKDFSDSIARLDKAQEELRITRKKFDSNRKESPANGTQCAQLNKQFFSTTPDKLHAANKTTSADTATINRLNAKLAALTKDSADNQDKLKTVDAQLRSAHNEMKDMRVAHDRTEKHLGNVIKQLKEQISEQQAQIAQQQTQHVATSMPVPATLAPPSASQLADTQDLYDRLRSIATDVLTHGSFMATREFGDMGAALQAMREFLRSD
jgi:chromosome segregation ATPase